MDSQIDVAIVPTIELMAWTALELRHLPDFLEAAQLLNACLKALPLEGGKGTPQGPAPNLRHGARELLPQLPA